MKNKKMFFGVLMIVVWIGVIYGFSASDASSSTAQTQIVIDYIKNIAQNNSFINNILIKLSTEYSLVYSIRKLAHLTIFCVLQIISFWVIKSINKSWIKATIYSMLIVVLYAIFDEIHQYFVPGRSCQIKDVFIDTLGGTVGLCISYFILTIKYTYSKILLNIKDKKVQTY